MDPTQLVVDLMEIGSKLQELPQGLTGLFIPTSAQLQLGEREPCTVFIRSQLDDLSQGGGSVGESDSDDGEASDDEGIEVAAP